MMETSTDRYLHKKFKKQLNLEGSSFYQNEERTNALIVPNLQTGSVVANEAAIPGVLSQNADNVSVITSNNVVPNFSTNNESVKSNASCNVKSSISHFNVGERREAITTEVDPQSSNTCISYVISKHSRLDNRNQPEIHFRTANFDTRFNNSEPIGISTVGTSSILDNVYTEQYVTSKLVHVDKIEDISSNFSIVNNDHISHSESTLDSRTLESNYSTEFGSAEKGSGGKYICSYCNLACSKPSVLQKHIRAHTNERPYPCVSCGFSFKTRSNLYKHCRSRTHANRVMGNKANNELEADSSSKMAEILNEDSNNSQSRDDMPEDASVGNERLGQNLKNKPYKPRFHNSRVFFDVDDQDPVQKPSNSDLLSLHINEVISKNNAIVNTNEPYLLRKRSMDNSLLEGATNNGSIHRYNEVGSPRQQVEERSVEEPLNLTHKIRKRCVSEVIEPTIHKSLIKELLLKNLYADSMQCPHCKMIFQTVTELELHKMRSCKGLTKVGPRYNRSSSVNVASILTKNKNAFDSMPYYPSTTFPLKSPGPFLGNTRLVESDKSKSFSFDDSFAKFQSTQANILKSPLRYSLSPLCFEGDRAKKAPVKLFGGEVKITPTSGTKSFKIDSKDNERYHDRFLDHDERLSENRVVKSSLQSGGTVLQNKASFNNKQESLRSPTDVIRMYDTSEFDKAKFNYGSQSTREVSNLSRPLSAGSGDGGTSYKYTNIMDFSQKAVKLLAPNLKQPNLRIPGVPVPVPPKIIIPHSPLVPVDMNNLEMPKLSAESSPLVPKAPQLSHKQIRLLKTDSKEQPVLPAAVCNPVNLLVNGKVVRYVPGMPGPVAAESPVAYASNTLRSPASLKSPSPLDTRPSDNLIGADSDRNTPKYPDNRITVVKSPLARTKSPNRSSPSSISETPKRFARPNTLALKPSISAQKQHHGLTPTMFNQILISPDTPRIAKKYMQHFLHGNYFSYLGLKSSTKSVYCTLNKTQPFYVPHFKKLSMYSEWRQQDIKGDKLYVSAYDSRQRQPRYVTAGKASADLVVHSSYKFINDSGGKQDEQNKSTSILGGYESNEDYTYVRGRGRGRYVCDQCGIRCKKPSMLKKHIKTHTNDRPYTCSHCNFSFKTKGNLTKHMKSKAHTKNYTASSSSNSSAHQSGTQSSDSDTEDSGMDSSDESTRQQEHEAAYGLLSLSQKTPQNASSNSEPDINSLNINPVENSSSFMNAEQITQVNNKNFAKNKILDRHVSLNFSASKITPEVIATNDRSSKDTQSFHTFFGTNRPLTYPYTSEMVDESLSSQNAASIFSPVVDSSSNLSEPRKELQNTSAFSIVQKHNVHYSPPEDGSGRTTESKSVTIPITISYDSSYLNQYKSHDVVPIISNHQRPIPSVKVNDRITTSYESVPADVRKRKVQEVQVSNSVKVIKINSESEAMDLSMPSLVEKSPAGTLNVNGILCNKDINHYTVIETNNKVKVAETAGAVRKPEYKNEGANYSNDRIQMPYEKNDENSMHNCDSSEELSYSEESDNAINLKMSPKNKADDSINVNYVIQENSTSVITAYTDLPNSYTPMDYDNSAMETLADVATKQVKLEKNTLAKSVASEYLKLATKNEFQSMEGATESNKEVTELMVKPEENKNCTICSKSFSKPSQLRLHMNIHYLERPFRCDPCSVSFRTKGHFQKHERSAGHHNKLSSSPMFSSSEPRPFKCSDCKVAFRIHGHLAKHLRSKLHIMKLECLAKIPFGLYAELERANSLLTEINTTDGDQCLESLKALARKVFVNDPSKLNQLEVSMNNVDSSNS
uniref:C2H2-type domain-containing protein n=1 Tax=Photinus pyralis TaxID=7054 RepID=A0A1Y1L3Y8_PHOPY